MYSYQPASHRGQGLVEYALVLAFVAVVVIVVLAATGQRIQDIFCDVTIKLGAGASDNIAACAAPRVTISGIGNSAKVSGPIAVEAVVKDNKGEESIKEVKFYINDILIKPEYIPRYCLGSGDDYCRPYDFSSLSKDTSHRLRVVATDKDGNTGETTVIFAVE